jgi:hypothetical protein
MKTTMMFRSIANPRRTTLAALADADTPQSGGDVSGTGVKERAAAGAESGQAGEPGQGEGHRELPESTANPRRTTVVDPPR